MSEGRAWRFLLLVLLVPLGAAGAPPAAPTAGVSGAFLRQEGKRPIPGALVVLYESGSGYLVDSTYTREDGRFALRPPLRQGSYHLVATQGDMAERVTLTYDPAAPGVYREILHRSEKSFWAKAWQFLLSLIKGFFGTIAAFLLGYFLKEWEGRRGAIKNLNGRALDLRGRAQKAGRELAEAIERIQRPLDTAQYRGILADLLPRVEAIETELAKGQDVAVEVGCGQQYGEYRDLVDRIKKIAGSQEAVGFGQASDRLRELAALMDELATRSLLPARLPWWRRTASTS